MFPEESGDLEQMQILSQMKNISKMCGWENFYKGGGYWCREVILKAMISLSKLCLSTE